MKNVLTVLCLLLALASLAQNPLEVGLKNAEVLYPSKLVRKAGFSKKPYLLLNDSIELKMNQVRYYQTHEDYFLVRSVDGFIGQEMRRIEDGTIKVYTFRAVDKSEPGHVSPLTGQSLGRSAARYYYFQKNKGALKPLTSANMEYALYGNEEALAQMKVIPRKKLTRMGMWVAGGVMTIVGLTQMTKKANEAGPEASIRPNGLFVVGLVTFTLPFFLRINKHEDMLKAVRIYNR